jgi:hypothetical protein
MAPKAHQQIINTKTRHKVIAQTKNTLGDGKTLPGNNDIVDA